VQEIRPTTAQLATDNTRSSFCYPLFMHTKLRNYYGAWESGGNRDDLPIEKK
jgi:hypothetical protein